MNPYYSQNWRGGTYSRDEFEVQVARAPKGRNVHRAPTVRPAAIDGMEPVFRNPMVPPPATREPRMNAMLSRDCSAIGISMGRPRDPGLGCHGGERGLLDGEGILKTYHFGDFPRALGLELFKNRDFDTKLLPIVMVC